MKQALRVLACSLALVGFVAVVAAVTNLLLPAPPQERPLEMAPPAVTWVWRVADAFGEDLGSAFPIEQKQVGNLWAIRLLTARHVISDFGKNDKIILKFNGKRFEVTRREKCPKKDVAWMDTISETPVRIAQVDYRKLRAGERIYAAGFPMGVYSVVAGYVSAPTVISAPLHYGSSGGPVIDSRGRLVGIVSGFGARRFKNEYVEFKQPITHIGRIVPMSTIRKRPL